MGTPLDLDLRLAEERLRADLANCSDVVYRTIAVDGGLTCLLVYIEGMVSLQRLERTVMSTLLYRWQREPGDRLAAARDGLASYLSRQVLPATRLWVIASYTELYDHLLEGDVILLTGGPEGALAIRLEDEPERQTEEPVTEPVIRGPREGFTEVLRTNTALLRRRLRSRSLKLEKLTVGSVTRSGVVMAYLRDIAEPALVDEVRRRLSRIQIDGVLESGYLEEFLEDHPYSPFSQIQNTERPDVAASAILEGRVAILTEGTPFVLIVPVVVGIADVAVPVWSGFMADFFPADRPGPPCRGSGHSCHPAPV